MCPVNPHVRSAAVVLAPVLLLALAGCGALSSSPTVATPPAASQSAAASAEPSIDGAGLTGRIAFMRGDPSEGVLAGQGVIYTVNADGSDLQQLLSDSAGPIWSPDGTEIHVFCCDDGMAAHFLDPATGELVRSLPQPDPSVEVFCGGSWSADGDRLSCAAFSEEDPSLNGVYTIRASDGGGLQRVTSNPGGFDSAGDFSPDGERLVFTRFVDEAPVGVFVAALDGSEPVQVSPPDLVLDETGFGGSWSPDGNQILFVAQADEDQHKEIWIVDADGSSPHRFEMTPACGGSLSDPSSAGCYSPEWSPDGSMIVFTRSGPDGENIYIVNADGTGLRQVTDGGTDDNPDWGVPLADG
jgi:Tol biopolymer transport system component